MKVLFIGDIFGNAGRRVLAAHLAAVVEKHDIDLCIANGENAAGGWGLTANILKKLHKYGVQVVTGGNHSFANQDILPAFESDPSLLRPLNFPPGNPGIGKTVYTLPDGRKAGVVNLQGRTFFPEALDCPFRLGLEAIEELRRETPVIIVDFHAEATSEKIAFATYIDGKASAVLGTHTHVQTADERVFPGGTAFISDVGMTGPEQSAIGMKTKGIVRRFLLQTPVRFEPSNDGPMLNAVVVDIDDATGRTAGIARVFERVQVP
ncbi:MAG: TIGR00282 family metallophosphoesterase [Chitinivibrionales bacterium]|nr:TIGR00282 family metallophosphoesterase [Chitinivibrionales bacterium]MBD3395834.1 TIGR00282 family metallophosphoesterase [Chitinivibrionales bacterium]